MNKSLIKKALALCVSVALLVSGLMAATVFSVEDTAFFNFEDSVQGWTGTPQSSGGGQFGSSALSQYTATGETDPLVLAGTKSLKVDMTAYDSADYAYKVMITTDGTVNGVALEPGQQFRFNFYFPTGSTLRVVQIGHTGTPNYNSGSAIVKGSWFHIDFTVPGDRDLTNFYITLVGNGGINETAYIDSVTMTVPATPTPDPSIPVNLVAGMNGQGIRAVAGDITNVSDLTFGSETTMPLTRLTNGDQTDHIDIYGGLNDVDHPGVRYDLGAVYALSEVNFFGATGETITPLGVDIYASTSLGDLFTEGNRVYTTTDNNAAKKGIVLASAKSARYVAFLMTQKGDVGGYRPAEFEVFGEQAITVPNILVGNAGQGFRAVEGDIANISDLTFGSESSMPLTRLTNEDQADHIDIYGGLNEADDPGVHYDLGAVYTLTEINFFGATGSTITPLGVDIYASETYEDLFTAGNRVYSITSDNTAKKGIVLGTPKDARYVAFIMTDVGEVGGYRPAEFEAFGVPQGSPLPTVAPTATPEPTAEPTAAPTTAPETDDSDYNFETGVHGFTTQAATSTYGTCAVENETSTVFLGSQSLKLTKDSADTKKAYRIYMNNAASLVAEDTYTFHVYVPTNSPLNHIEIWSDYSAGNATYYENLAQGEWLELSYTIPAESGLNGMFLNFMYNTNDPTGAEVVAFVDSIQINSAPEPTSTPEPTAEPTPSEPTIAPAQNLILGIEGDGIKAVEGNMSDVQDVTFDTETQYPLSKLTDGQFGHIDVYGGLNNTDHPGFLYDLGAEYDVSEVYFYGIDNVGYTPKGVRIYASDSLSTLYDISNKVYEISNNYDTKKGTILASAKRARYVAFFITQRSDDDQLRPAECQVFGVNPGDPIPTPIPTAIPTAAPTPTVGAIPTPVAGTDEAHFNFETDVQGWYVQNDITSNPAYGQGTVETSTDVVYAGANSLKIGLNGGVGRKVYRVQMPTTNLVAGDTYTFKLYAPYGSRIDKIDVYTYNPTTSREFTGLVAQEWNIIEYTVPLTVTAQPAQFWINVWLKDGGEGFDYPAESIYVDNVTKSEFVPTPTPDPYEEKNFVLGVTPEGGRAVAGNYEMWETVTFGSPSDLSLIADGNTTQHFDVYGGFADEADGDRPGFLFTLSNYYDLETVNVHVFDDDSRELTISGVRVYASDERETLFNSENLVYEVSGDLEPLKTFTLDTPKRVRYIALYLTETQSGWRPREFEAIGSLSQDQGDLEGVEGPTNVLLGMPPFAAGVAETEDYFSLINGGGTANFGEMLTDGFKSDQTVQLWGAKDRPGSKFVITYDLGQNYDITQAAAYVWPSADYQGVEAWDVYMSRYYDELFLEDNKFVGRQSFDDPASLKITAVKNTVRYISFVFTQPDYEVYGALRLFEVEAFGTVSDIQDVPEEPEEYDPYVQVPHADSGVTLNITKLDESDDFEFNGTFTVTTSTGTDELADLGELLDLRYRGQVIYNFSITDDYGDPYDFGGRTVKVVIDIPADLLGEDIYLAVLDGDNTELMNASIVNGQFVFFTSNVQSYAIVKANAAGDPGVDTNPDTSDIMSVTVVIMALIAASAVVIFSRRRIRATK